MPNSIDLIAARLQAHSARRIPGRRWVRRCGVVLLLADSGLDAHQDEPVVLLMKRAERNGDPWSGHVSFPGGRVARDDASTRAEPGRKPMVTSAPVATRSPWRDALRREARRLTPPASSV